MITISGTVGKSLIVESLKQTYKDKAIVVSTIPSMIGDGYWIIDRKKSPISIEDLAKPLRAELISSDNPVTYFVLYDLYGFSKDVFERFEKTYKDLVVYFVYVGNFIYISK